MNWKNLLLVSYVLLLTGCISTSPQGATDALIPKHVSQEPVAALNAIPLDGKLAILKPFNGRPIQVDHFYVAEDRVYYIDRKTKSEGDVPREEVKAVIIKKPRNALILSGGGLILSAALLSDNAAATDNLYESLAKGGGTLVLGGLGITVVVLGIVRGKQRYSIN